MYKAIYTTSKSKAVLYSSPSLGETVAYISNWLGYPLINWGTNGVDRGENVLFGYEDFNDGCLEVIWEKD